MDEELHHKAIAQSRDMLADLGQMVVSWNGLEDQVRSVLTLLASNGEEVLLRQAARAGEVKSARNRARILTTHLGNVTLTDAIRAYSKANSPELAEHLNHLCLLFDRLREHRNFYAHGSRGPGTNISQDGRIETSALATQVSAKGSLSISSVRFGKGELEQFIKHMGSANRYIDSITHALLNPDMPPERHPSWCTPLPTLQKPRIPDRLLKSRQYLIGEAPPPQS